MRIKVLGCSGAGSPGRNSTAFLLGDRILFDAGSLTQALSRKEQLKIEFIFVTHTHLDHNGLTYSFSPEVFFRRRFLEEMAFFSVSLASTAPEDTRVGIRRFLGRLSLWRRS